MSSITQTWNSLHIAWLSSKISDLHNGYNTHNYLKWASITITKNGPTTNTNILWDTCQSTNHSLVSHSIMSSSIQPHGFTTTLLYPSYTSIKTHLNPIEYLHLHLMQIHHRYNHIGHV